MKIPKTIKVGAFDYEVEMDKKLSEATSTYGQCMLDKQIIYLDPQYKQQKKEQVFFHEVLHAVWDSAGLNSRDHSQKQEEEIVDALSHGIYQVLKDNKLLK